MASAKPLTAPRKAAAQARSRATVDALVEATARILVKEGFDKASTNRIAETAGVSVGSLYQYFPGKAALVAAVIDRHRRDILRVVSQAMGAAQGLPLEPATKALVAAAIEAHRLDPDLHRVLAEQIPHDGARANMDVLGGEAYGLIRTFLERHEGELRELDLDLAAFVCVTTIEALTHTAVLHRPELLAGDAADALVEDTTRLVLGYLRWPPTGPAPC